MKSMTGYGRGVASHNNRTVSVELKSVNNRFSEISCKLPKALMYLDDTVQKRIKSVVSRGSLDVYLTYENLSESSKKLTVDKNLANEYALVAKTLRTEFRLEDDFGVTAMIRTPEVVTVSVPEDDREEVLSLAVLATDEALVKLDEMRKTEGEAIKADLLKLIKNLSEYLAKAKARAPLVVVDYKAGLIKRNKELLDGYEADESKVINEVAFFADKADINEEIQRLGSHIDQFVSICKEDNAPQGRRLDFLSQEMVREVNTMGSKSNDITLTGYVVAMKNEVEKIKEQIRNVE